MSAPVEAEGRLGTDFVGYRIDAVVGRGGMGVVYRAHDLRLKRNVALKLIASEYVEDERFRERFLAETELAASLEHPDVVPVYDAGEVDGQLYLAMRLVEGSDLRRLLADEGSLEAARAVRILGHVADALDAAHERGLVHRDVKPSNVLLDEREHPYLADFGLTRRLDDPASPTAGLSVGTPAYVAPEQIRGDDIDGRADQYALACMLAECVTGSPPFRRPSEVALLYAHLEDAPLPTGGPLDSVLARALAKDPTDRYLTCADLVRASEEALGLAYPRRRRWPYVAAVVGIAVVVGALAAALLRDTSPGAPEAGRLVRITPDGEVDTSFAVGTEPNAVALSPGKVWVTDRVENTITRLDQRSGAIELGAPAHGTPTDIAVSGQRVVVTYGPNEPGVVFLSTGTGGEERSHGVAEGIFPFGSPYLATRGDDIWVATGGRRVGRFSITRGRFTAAATLPRENDEADSFVSALAGEDDAVWVAGDPNETTLWRIDPATHAIAARVPLPSPPTDVTTGFGAVWISSQLHDTVIRLDPATNRITSQIRVGRGAGSVATGGGYVWVANELAGTVTRIDPVSLAADEIDVGGSPLGIAADKGAVWVTTRPLPAEAAADAISIGVVASCEGPFAPFADLSFAGAELPLLRRGAQLAGPKPSAGVKDARIAGKDVRLYPECTDDSAKTALATARRLVEGVGVDILIGPTQASEAFAIRNYARTRPETTFLGGTAYPQALTLRDSPPNFFRFTPDGPQWAAGLGSYAYHELGWRRVVTISDDWLAGYVTSAGFAAEFCSLGGQIVEQVWTPLGVRDVRPYVSRVPSEGVDGFLMAGVSSTTQGFIDELPQLRGDLSRKIVGTIFLWELVDNGEPLDRVAVGDALGAQPEGSPFMIEFRKLFPDLAPFAWDIWSVFFHNPMEAALIALESVDGELGDGQRAFRKALADSALDGPTGRIRLDGRRQAIAPNFVVNYRKPASGGPPVTHVVQRVEGVEQTFNGYFRPTDPPLGRDTIRCNKGNPPAWARR